MSIILIAAPEHLQALKQREELGGAQAFSDSEALRALEVITRQRPEVVALDGVFAVTARGGALINRIKADPKLASCEIRIIAHNSEQSRFAGGHPDSTADAGVAVAAAAPIDQLDQKGTRLAARHRIVDGVEVMIDGNPAMLVDLSLCGAQVVSTTILKPNQRVRIALADGRRPIWFSAGVAWAAFELAKTGPQYRAGIQFFDADAEAIQRFCDAKQKPA